MRFLRVDVRDDAVFNAWFALLQRFERHHSDEDNMGWHPEEWRSILGRDGAQSPWPVLLRHYTRRTRGGGMVAWRKDF